MREILFRGKGDKKYNTGEWYYGVPIQDSYGDWQICNHYSKRVVIPSTIGEYTGLKDKNGTRIFEGDIVKTERDLWRSETKKEREIFVSAVQYDNKKCSFGLWGKYKHLTLMRFKGSFNEVIGNIHDNPELLESEG